MLDTSARLLRLLRLLGERRFWEGASLCDALEITDRTLRRDIDRLRSLGYRIDAAPGVGGGYRLGPGRGVPPMPFDDEEAAAVALGLRLSATGPLGGLEQAAVRALSKLEAVMPRRLRSRLSAMSRAVQMDAARPTRVHAPLLVDLAEACDRARVVRFGYRRRDGAHGTREAEAHRLVFVHEHWYLFAWDRARADWRTFRVDRVDASSLVVEEAYAPRALPAEDLVAYVAGSLVTRAWPIEAEVVLTATEDELLGMTLRGPVEPAGHGRWRMVFSGEDLDWMALYLCLLRVPFEVVRPLALQEALVGLARRCLTGATPRAPAPGQSGDEIVSATSTGS